MPDAESIQWYALDPGWAWACVVCRYRASGVRFSRNSPSVSALRPASCPSCCAPIARRVGFDTRHARPALKGRLLAVHSVFAPARPPS